MKSKVRLGIIFTHLNNWTGGSNYLENLLYSISESGGLGIDIFIFTGKNNRKVIERFAPLSTLIFDSLFDRRSFFWIVEKLFVKFFKRHFFLTLLLRRYKIQILTHSEIHIKIQGMKIINWIPDFQHLHYPEYFSKKEIQQREKMIKGVCSTSDLIILSSNSSLQDFQIHHMEFSRKVRILKFTSCLPSRYNEPVNIEYLKDRFNIAGKYFFVPNQFWKHKNHKVILEALTILKSNNKDVMVIFSGNMNDTRDPDYLKELVMYVNTHSLQNSVKFLGLLEYRDVVSLMKYSIAVINPSFFEGWSTTVEECKSLGKNIILSNINTHLEQSPEHSFYFNPDDPDELANILSTLWAEGSVLSYSNTDGKNLKKRIIDFASNYQKIVFELIN